MIVAVINQKGGVGKTTTTFQLGKGLANQGFRVLMIDMDPQGNMGYIAGIEEKKPTIFEVLVGEVPMKEAIHSKDNFDFLLSSTNLSVLHQHIPKNFLRVALKMELDKIRNDYDYIVIDSPPTLGTLTANVMTAADKVIIPAIADIMSLQGIGQLFTTVEAVRKYTNARLEIDGILLTRHNDRLLHSRALREMMQDTAKEIGTKVYQASIREGVKIREACTSQQSIFDYAPRCRQAADYAEFIEEFLTNNRVNR